jgi:ABC-2 type transport system permease protein
VARLLVRLKVRLVVNTLHRGVQPALGLIAAAVGGTLFAASIAVMLTAAGAWDGFGELIVVVFAAVWVGWLLLPALTFSSDETLDPRRFALLPLRRPRLVRGLLAAGLVGVGPLTTLVGASGGAFGAMVATGGSPLAGFVGAAAVVVLLVTSVAWSRALLTTFSNVLGTRRGRDIAALVAGTLAVLAYVASQVLPRLELDGGIDLTLPSAVLRWTPGGMAGAAVAGGVDGAPAVALAWLVAAALTTPLALWLWSLALARVDRTSPARSSSRGPSALYPRALGWLPRDRTGVVAVRFLRSLTRDPRVRAQALSQLFIVVPMAVVFGTTGGLGSDLAPLAVAAIAFPVGLIASNQFGMDGPALWLHEVAGADPWADLRGRNLAVCLVGLPLLVVVMAGATVVAGSAELVPAGALLSLAVLGTSLGVANAAAVLLPIPVPERGDNLFGSSTSGQGCVNSILLMVVLLVLGLLLLPLFLSAFLLSSTGARTASTLAGLGYGAAWWWGGTRIAVSRLAGRGPELLAAVHPDD